MSLRIVVTVKYVPDATGDRHFADDLTVDRDDVDGLLSELDEYAVEQALQISENSDDDVEVTVLTVGPEDAKDALRKALSMGADKAIHVEDDDLHGTDAIGTSLVLAKAVEKAGYDLVISGMASTDGTMGVVPALLAERLGVPQVTLLSEVSVEDGTVKGRRDGDSATEQLEASLPAVVSVTDQSGEARYPSFKGIMAAKKKPVEVLGCPTSTGGGGSSRITGRRAAQLLGSVVLATRRLNVMTSRRRVLGLAAEVGTVPNSGTVSAVATADLMPMRRVMLELCRHVIPVPRGQDEGASRSAEGGTEVRRQWK
ncbi:Protein FixA [Streptomyces alboniger]